MRTKTPPHLPFESATTELPDRPWPAGVVAHRPGKVGYAVAAAGPDGVLQGVQWAKTSTARSLQLCFGQSRPTVRGSSRVVAALVTACSRAGKRCLFLVVLLHAWAAG
jgi:hypothetical protein